ncbi:MAG TPA: diguanylate cyclase [Alphaproteobacteria bacterium]|nr:diguanylate cyclase [Alphaproteobacteria bacterium]
MAFTYVSREELQAVLTHLDQATYNHIQWYNSLIRTLICRLPVDKHNISQKSHEECTFGQWYYNDSPQKLRDHPGFSAVGDAHQHMHQMVTHLLFTQEAGNQIEAHDYDSFANAMERMRLEMASLKHEVEVSLYTHDPLTGAINRTDMLPILRELHEMVKRDSQECSIAMMDIDLFKNINDKFGHSAGDKALVALVRYMTEHLHPYDKLFRYGGEEFLFCMQQTDIPSSYQRIEALRIGISEMPIEIGPLGPIKITASFGVAALDQDFSIQESVDHADKALFVAKANGRNCTRIWDSTM